MTGNAAWKEGAIAFAFVAMGFSFYDRLRHLCHSGPPSTGDVTGAQPAGVPGYGVDVQ